MRKILKISLFIALSLILVATGFLVYGLAVSKTAKLDKNKIINFDNKITVCTLSGDIITEEINDKSVVNPSSIPDHVKKAFVAIEDKRFYKHKGVDYKGLIRATVKNAFSLSFKEGGSTITQQLIKNTHFSDKKTLSRKFKEIKLAKELEKEFTKDEILCAYLNTIYFGDGCFGINSASKHYFSKEVSDLSLNESAILAGLVKSPLKYSPTKNEDNCFNRKNLVLKCMYDQKYISKDLYNQTKNKRVLVDLSEKNPQKDYIYLVNKELDEILPDHLRYSKNLKVYTFFDKEKQEILDNGLNLYDLKTDKTGIILDAESRILAYSSSVGEIKRQLGSTIKPLVVYAPAIETNTVCSLTPILDEKIDFNGYSPSNYGDIYHGYVSVKESLSKSLNIPAVKVLNSVGISKACSYLNKTAIKIDKDDENLSLALGSTKNGATLKELTNSYSVLYNDGQYKKSSCIDKIVDENGKILYSYKAQNSKVFSSDTVSIVNDMTLECAKSGTAKKLSYLPFDLYAKTGTVGNSNGNLDAYSISYNPEYCLGVWIGNRDNSLMDNSITGGSFPTTISYDVWNNIYKNSTPPDKFPLKEVVELSIDKLSYDEDHKILLADENTPLRYQIKGIFKLNDKPKSKSKIFSSPNIENIISSVDFNRISIRLCLKEYYNARLYKVVNGKRKLVFDTINSIDKTYIDTDVLPNEIYEYIAIPYYIANGKEYYGEEVILDKIKTPTSNVGENWWDNDFN